MGRELPSQVTQYLHLEAAARSWLGPGLEFVEGLGGLGEGVGDGLVPVHVRAAGAQFPGVLFTQGCRHGRVDLLSGPCRFEDVGFGGTQDDRGSIRPGCGERGREYVEGDAHPEAVTAPPKAADGTAAEVERGGPAGG